MQSPLSYERWIRLIMIRHATHTHTQNDFALLETWYLIWLNIPTKLPCLAIYQGQLIIVATQEKQNNNYNFSVFEPMKENLLLPTQKKEKKSGRNETYSSSCSDVSMSCPMLGTWEVHSAAATVQLIPDLPRTKAASLGRSVEVPVKLGCILPRQCI